MSVSTHGCTWRSAMTEPLTTRQKILIEIERLGEKATQAKVARGLGLSPSTVSYHCDVLEDGGRIQRRPFRSGVTLTDHGISSRRA